MPSLSGLSLIGLGLLTLSLTGCDQKKQTTEERLAALSGAAKCETDKECAKGFICKEKRCAKGERTAEELKAKAKAEEKARMDAIAEKNKVKPGEGRLYARICPIFKNTPEAIGTILAIHQETKKRHFINLAMEVPDGGWQDQFVMPSVPLGTYDVTATYGIQKDGKADVVNLKCDAKAKPCRESITREITVVEPKDETPLEIDKKTKEPVKRPCDFQAE